MIWGNLLYVPLEWTNGENIRLKDKMLQELSYLSSPFPPFLFSILSSVLFYCDIRLQLLLMLHCKGVSCEFHNYNSYPFFHRSLNLLIKDIFNRLDDMKCAIVTFDCSYCWWYKVNISFMNFINLSIVLLP